MSLFVILDRKQTCDDRQTKQEKEQQHESTHITKRHTRKNWKIQSTLADVQK